MRTVNTDHGQISAHILYADIVPDGNEEQYLNMCAVDRMPSTNTSSWDQIAEVKIGNKSIFDLLRKICLQNPY